MAPSWGNVAFQSHACNPAIAGKTGHALRTVEHLGQGKRIRLIDGPRTDIDMSIETRMRAAQEPRADVGR